MDNTTISVIMAVYNCENTIREAIDSILMQTYDNWKFIICNDCSTDQTQSILEEYRDRFPDKFVILKNEKNMHLAYSLNQCLKYATGRYVARMDGDDRSAPDRFEIQVAFLQEHPEYDLVGTSMRRFNEDGLADTVDKPEFVDKYTMRTVVPFNHATIMTYPTVYEALGGYTVSERTNRAQDYDLWFRFFHAGFSGYNIQEPLYFVREDMNAIKRRTFKVRWNAYKTTRIGFRLLGFPRRWLIKPLLTVFLKSIVPYKAVYFYRKLQGRQKN